MVVCKYSNKKRRALDSNQRIPYDIGSLANCWFKPLTQPSLNHLFCKRAVQIYYLFWYLQNFRPIIYCGNLLFACHTLCVLLLQLSKKLPHNHACRHRNVERVLDAHLRNLYCAIYHIGDTLVHALDLVAKDQGILCVRLSTELVEHRCALNLLYGNDLVAFIA